MPRLCNAVWSRRFGAAQWHRYFTHFKIFHFPNIIGLVQRTVRFVMRTEPRSSYRTVQYEYAYCYRVSVHNIYQTDKLSTDKGDNYIIFLASINKLNPISRSDKVRLLLNQSISLIYLRFIHFPSASDCIFKLQ